MIDGYLTITNNVEIVNNALCSGGKVLLLSEQPDSKIIQSPNIIPATILLPLYESVMAELDGELEISKTIYYEQLASKEADMFICAITRALFDSKGMHIVIYAGEDEMRMSFVGVLMSYFFNEYGITIGSDMDNFSYNVAYDAVLLCKWYLYELIDYNYLFMLYPAPVNIPEYIIPKLIFDMNPYVANTTMEEYYRYFNEYKNRVKQNNNQVLICPISRG